MFPAHTLLSFSADGRPLSRYRGPARIAPQSRWALARRELAAPGFAREFLLFLAATCGGGGAALLLLVALAGEAARG